MFLQSKSLGSFDKVAWEAMEQKLMGRGISADTAESMMKALGWMLSNLMLKPGSPVECRAGMVCIVEACRQAILASDKSSGGMYAAIFEGVFKTELAKLWGRCHGQEG